MLHTIAYQMAGSAFSEVLSSVFLNPINVVLISICAYLLYKICRGNSAEVSEMWKPKKVNGNTALGICCWLFVLMFSN